MWESHRQYLTIFRLLVTTNNKIFTTNIKDTSQLINELKELKVDPHSSLVTIDVKSLYTFISHLDDIQALARKPNKILLLNTILLC